MLSRYNGNHFLDAVRAILHALHLRGPIYPYLGVLITALDRWLLFDGLRDEQRGSLGTLLTVVQRLAATQFASLRFKTGLITDATPAKSLTDGEYIDVDIEHLAALSGIASEERVKLIAVIVSKSMEVGEDKSVGNLW